MGVHLVNNHLHRHTVDTNYATVTKVKLQLPLVVYLWVTMGKFYDLLHVL